MNTVSVQALFPNSAFHSTLLRFHEETILVDCGAEPPYDNFIATYSAVLPQVSAILLTGASRFHAGFLPLLKQCGYARVVFHPQDEWFKAELRCTLQQLMLQNKRELCGYQPHGAAVTAQAVLQSLSSEAVRALEPGRLLGLSNNLSARPVASGAGCAYFVKHSFFAEEVLVGSDLQARDFVFRRDFQFQNEKNGSSTATMAVFRAFRALPNVQLLDVTTFTQQISRCLGVTIVPCQSLGQFLNVFMAVKLAVKDAAVLAEPDQSLSDLLRLHTNNTVPVVQQIKKEKIVFTIDGLSSQLSRKILTGESQVNNADFLQQQHNQILLIVQSIIPKDSYQQLLARSVLRKQPPTIQVTKSTIVPIEERQTQQLRNDEIRVADFANQFTQSKFSELNFDAIVEQLKKFDYKDNSYIRPANNGNKKILYLEHRQKWFLLEYCSGFYKRHVQLQNTLQQNRVLALQQSKNYFDVEVRNPQRLPTPLTTFVQFQQLEKADSCYKFSFKNVHERLQGTQEEFTVLAAVAQMIMKKFDVDAEDSGLVFHLVQRESETTVAQKDNYKAEPVVETMNMPKADQKQPKFKSVFNSEELQPIMRQKVQVREEAQQAVENKQLADVTYNVENVTGVCRVSVLQTDFNMDEAALQKAVKSGTVVGALTGKCVTVQLQQRLQNVVIALPDKLGNPLFGEIVDNKFVCAPLSECDQLMPMKKYTETVEEIEERLKGIGFAKKDGNKYLRGEEAVEIQDNKVVVAGRFAQQVEELIWL